MTPDKPEIYEALLAAFNEYGTKYQDYLKYRFVFCVNQQIPEFSLFQEVLMWSHYADQHKGICLGLSMQDLLLLATAMKAWIVGFLTNQYIMALKQFEVKLKPLLLM